MVMKMRAIALCCALLVVALGAGPGQARTIGQAIDDAAIVTSIKAKLTADRLSNLFKIDVKSDEGVVTLSGTVDTAERRDRIVQIASWASGVKRIIDDIQVSSSGASVSAPAASSGYPSGRTIDATGSVAGVEPSTGTLRLADGRVLRATNDTVIWQSSTLPALRPGAPVLIRNGAPAGLDGRASLATGWRMGTVSRVDRASGQVVLTDGTVVRVSPSTVVQRGTERLTLDALQPGWEIVVRTPAATAVDASQIDVVWAPTASVR
jgi:hyperosmotically inducible protein